jgi:PhzF family phenazine biosynthesis protein
MDSMKIPIYQIDAFANKTFEGNPAAVCPLDSWLPDELMQSIAAENNLAETAFFVPANDGFDIRWFTPAAEVDLCGHATLASAYVLFDILKFKRQQAERYR